MRRMVVASFCEILRILCNMNFNVPLYDILQKLLAGYINCINLGIYATLSRIMIKSRQKNSSNYHDQFRMEEDGSM